MPKEANIDPPSETNIILMLLFHLNQCWLDLHMVVPESFLFIYSFFLFLNTMQSFKQYLLCGLFDGYEDYWTIMRIIESVLAPECLESTDINFKTWRNWT